MSKSNYILSISAVVMVLGAASSVSMAAPSGYFINAEAGWFMPIHSTQTYTVAMPNTPQPSLLDDYISNSGTNNILLGAGFGYQFAHPNWAGSRWLPNYRIGILYDYFGYSTVNGYINKYQQVKAYDLTYNINSQALWLDGQADLFTYRSFTPFLELSLGAALNNSYAYAETPLTDQPRAGAAFADHTVTQFAYGAGAGVNYSWQIQQQVLNIGLSYRYVNLGNARTGASANYPTATQGLTMPIKANEVLLSLRTAL